MLCPKYSFWKLSLVIFIFTACNGSTDNTVLNSGELFAPYEINPNVEIYGVANKQQRQCRFFAYAIAYSIVEGQEFLDNNRLEVSVLKEKDRIGIDLRLDLSEYDLEKKKDEETNRVRFTLLLKDKANKVIAKLEEENAIIKKHSSTYFVITPWQYRTIKEGMSSLDISIEAELISFFGDKSNIHPAAVKMQIPFLVPKVYKSELYFKSLRLKEKETMELLGDNDWNDPAPEAGLIVTKDGVVVLNEFEKNSFELVGDFKSEIFYTSNKDTLKLSIVDVDYGFNGSDLIADTLIPIHQLESDSYINLTLPCVSELLIYTTSSGAVN